MPTPANPSTVAAARPRRHFCWRRMNISITSVMMGMVAASTETTPDGTYFSAQNSGPYSATNISRLKTSKLRHWRAAGSASPRASMNPSKTTPAMKKRAPAANNGGSSSTAMRMARNVVPHRK